MYVIELSGGHLPYPKYVHPSGLLVDLIIGAEQFELKDAIKSIRENLPETKCKMKAKYVAFTTDKTIQNLVLEIQLLKIKEALR